MILLYTTYIPVDIFVILSWRKERVWYISPVEMITIVYKFWLGMCVCVHGLYRGGEKNECMLKCVCVVY